MLRILVTGANGFVGRELCHELASRGFYVRAAVRNLHDVSGQDRPLFGTESSMHAIEQVCMGDIGPYTNWTKALKDVDVVVHLAARVHVMRETATNPLEVFRLVNTQGSIQLACSAVNSGVRRFIYLSTIKVNGEMTIDKSFTESDLPYPEDPYAVSKSEAEELLKELSVKTGLEVTILRPPLVYGPGVKGNFLRLMNLVNRGLPLPFAGINNRRSLVYIKNLVSLMIRCIDHPKAAGECFLVSDGHDLSTPDLIHLLSKSLNKPARLVHIPRSIIYVAAKLFRVQQQVNRVLGSLQVDSTKSRELLEWSPPYSVNEGIDATANWYMVNNK